MDMNFEINDGLIENHPLNVFAKLYSEDKKNKVYKECLENEIKNAIESLVDTLDNETIIFLKSMFDLYSIENEELNNINGLDDEFNHTMDEIKIRIYVSKKIINEVYKKRIKKD
jgi:hypothetical protein